MKGLFTGSVIDILTIQALFMSLIQEKIFNFLDSCNNYKIRKQRNRANHPIERSFMIYFHLIEGVKNFSCQVEASYLCEIQSHIHDYG